MAIQGDVTAAHDVAEMDDETERKVCEADVLRISRVLKRVWTPPALTVVLAASGYMVDQLHGILGSQANAGSGPAIEIVQFNPKVV